MIFADKLILLRKNSSWTQEELAEQMNVTRQSVSKWEGAQSVPDLEKIIKLSELFGVSTDYLLKDEIEEYEGINTSDLASGVKKVTMEEANTFLSLKKKSSKFIALAVFLFIISPITLIHFAVLTEGNNYKISENMGIGIGLIVLFVLDAIGTGIIILSISKLSDFKYLEDEIFETEYGVLGMVKERKSAYKDTYIRNNIIGVIFCILSIIPIFISLMINENDEVLTINMLSITIFIVGTGVSLLVNNGSIWGSFQQILQEGNYTIKNKENKFVMYNIGGAYWTLIVAIFLGYSFITNDWGRSWIIWPVAGLLFAAVMNLISTFKKK